jgi:hypothetical protein
MNIMSYNFICLKHIKTEYLTVNDPMTLWNNIRERYEHYKAIILSKTHYDWIHLKLHISFLECAPVTTILKA